MVLKKATVASKNFKRTLNLCPSPSLRERYSLKITAKGNGIVSIHSVKLFLRIFLLGSTSLAISAYLLETSASELGLEINSALSSSNRFDTLARSFFFLLTIN